MCTKTRLEYKTIDAKKGHFLSFRIVCRQVEALSKSNDMAMTTSWLRHGYAIEIMELGELLNFQILESIPKTVFEVVMYMEFSTSLDL